MITFGISGGRASFSEQATQQYAQEEKLEDIDIDYLVSVKNVLEALDKELIDIGIFPVENSSGGIVEESLYAMALHIFEIQKIFKVSVRHFLMALPGIKRETIIHIASHPAALRECQTYLKTQWPQIQLYEYEDTAKAAQALKAKILPATTAVIAPRVAADLYDLEIFDENIQDDKLNVTTFVAVKKKKS